MIEENRVGVIIPAAGRGTRMGGARSKQFLDLDGVPILLHTLRCFERLDEVDLIIIAAAPEAIPELVALQREHGLAKIARIVPGGKERQDSVWNALEAMRSFPVTITAVHDAVRPFASPQLIRRVLHAAVTHGAALAAVRPKETVKIGTPDGTVHATPPRETLWLAQTPQAFRFTLLVEAFRKAMAEQFYGTDEASLVERLGQEVRIVEGSYDNIKITTPDDLEVAKLIAKRVNTAGC